MRKMRRFKQEIPTDEAWELFKKCSSMTLCLSDENGAPYGVILSFEVIGKAVYFHSALEGRKIDLLRARPQVCLTALHHEENQGEAFNVFYASITAFGKATQVTDEAEKTKALFALCEKYAPGNTVAAEYIEPRLSRTAVFRIDIDHLTGKKQDSN